MIKKCLVCNKEFKTKLCHIRKSRGIFCSRKCLGISKKGKQWGKPFLKGQHYHPSTEFKKGNISYTKGLPPDKHPCWRGGRCKNSYGYILIYNPTHPHRNHQNYFLEHRLVVEKYLGRYLDPKEVVHHINNNRSDNRLENLKLFKNKSEHQKFHKIIN